MPEFAEPLWLWLLLLLPLVAWMRLKAGIAESYFKQYASLILRCASLAVLVIALAGPLDESQSARTDIVFVLDVSRSIDEEASRNALSFVNRAVAGQGQGVSSGLVVFGSDAAVERLLSESTEAFTEHSVQVSRGGSNIARALEVAVGSFQTRSRGQRRIILLTDGQENQGHARAAAHVARSVGVTIDTVALPRSTSRDEILITGLSAPASTREREPFELTVTIGSHTASSTHLVITRNGSPLDDALLTLQPGNNTFTFVDQADAPGLYEYEAIINSGQDQVQENNRYQAFVQVRGASKVLHAVGDDTAGRYVTSALQTQGLVVDEIAGIGLPASLHELVEYDLLILNNVSALDMSLAKMQLIEEYVRDAGGGLLILGGDKSYGAGGYYQTPVERALPVTMDIKTEVEVPSLAVTIIIDKSASMAKDRKLEVAKDAAFSAIQVLKPQDTVGVLAFADSPVWSVPLREVGDRRVIVEQLRLVSSGGSTDLYSALLEAHRVMSQKQSRIKHLILLSDGLSDAKGNVMSLVENIAGDGITISSVAFGGDADQSLMESIAAQGGGRYYYTKEADNVPRIFTSETLVVARNLIVEEPTQPQLQYPGELLNGIEATNLPALSGYQRVFPKPAAQVLLGAKEEDPLLVSWRYGLGRSVAFSSDLGGRWSRQWIEWPAFARFVAQTARWTMRRHGSERLLPQFRIKNQQAEILVDALDRDDRFINGLELQGTLDDPDQGNVQIQLQQISPGRYRGEFAVPREGRYYINLSGQSGQTSIAPETFGLAVPYSSEYLELGENRALLSAIAVDTGGRSLPLSAASTAMLTQADSSVPNYRGRVWWPALLAALVLLIAEIAVRKLVVPSSWQAAWELLWQKLLHRPAAKPGDQPHYDDLVADINQAREAHLNALKLQSRYSHDDPAARARLYMGNRIRNPGG